MRNLKFIGLALIILILSGVAPIRSIYVAGQENKGLSFYRELLSRALDIPNLPQDLRNRILDLLGTEAKTPEDISKFIDTAKGILREVGDLVEEQGDVSDVVEQLKLSSTISSLIELAKEMNDPSLLNKLSTALDLVKGGDVEGAKKILSEILTNIEEIRAEQSADAVEKSIMRAFERVPSNETAVEAILRAISNINITISVLEAVKNKLLETNASEAAIDALERVVEILNRTSGILWSVSEIVKSAGVESKAGNVTKKVALSRVEKEIVEIREDVDELMNKTITLENTLNITLNNVKDLLNNASLLLDEAEAQASTGNVGQAMKNMVHAKILVKKAKKILEDYEESEEEHAKKEGNLDEYVHEKYNDLSKDYQKTVSKVQELYSKALEVNSTNALNLLNEANNTLAQVLSMIDEINVLIGNESYEEALNMISDAKALLEYVDETLDTVEDMVETAHETIKEIFSKIEDLRDEVNDLEEKAYEHLTGTLLDKALAKIGGLRDKLDEAESLAQSSEIDQASNILKDVEKVVKSLEKIFEDVGEQLRDINELQVRIDELRDKYSNDTEILSKLDDAEQLLNEALGFLEQAIDEVDSKLIHQATKLVDDAKGIVDSIEESGTERFKIKFEIEDTEGNSVHGATVVFDGNSYHSGEVTRRVGGTYNISVGIIPDGYVFSHWSVDGDAVLNNSSASSTTVEVHGDVKITLVLERSSPGGSGEYTVSFLIREVHGNVVGNATIEFDGEDFHSGDSVQKAVGEYSLKVGELHEGYVFIQWRVEGQGNVANHNREETTVSVSGDITIIMIVRKKGGEDSIASNIVMDYSLRMWAKKASMMDGYFN